MSTTRLHVLLTFTHGDDHSVEQTGGSVNANLYGNKFFLKGPWRDIAPRAGQCPSPGIT